MITLIGPYFRSAAPLPGIALPRINFRLTASVLMPANRAVPLLSTQDLNTDPH